MTTEEISTKYNKTVSVLQDILYNTLSQGWGGDKRSLEETLDSIYTQVSDVLHELGEVPRGK